MNISPQLLGRLRLQVVTTVTESRNQALCFMFESDARGVADIIERYTTRGAVVVEPIRRSDGIDPRQCLPEGYWLRSGLCYVSHIEMAVRR